jgi:hypothetical protein
MAAPRLRAAVVVVVVAQAARAPRLEWPPLPAVAAARVAKRKTEL